MPNINTNNHQNASGVSGIDVARGLLQDASTDLGDAINTVAGTVDDANAFTIAGYEGQAFGEHTITPDQNGGLQQTVYVQTTASRLNQISTVNNDAFEDYLENQRDNIAALFDFTKAADTGDNLAEIQAKNPATLTEAEKILIAKAAYDQAQTDGDVNNLDSKLNALINQIERAMESIINNTFTFESLQMDEVIDNGRDNYGLDTRLDESSSRIVLTALGEQVVYHHSDTEGSAMEQYKNYLRTGASAEEQAALKDQLRQSDGSYVFGDIVSNNFEADILPKINDFLKRKLEVTALERSEMEANNYENYRNEQGELAYGVLVWDEDANSYSQEVRTFDNSFDLIATINEERAKALEISSAYLVEDNRSLDDILLGRSQEQTVADAVRDFNKMSVTARNNISLSPDSSLVDLENEINSKLSLAQGDDHATLRAQLEYIRGLANGTADANEKDLIFASFDKQFDYLMDGTMDVLNPEIGGKRTSLPASIPAYEVFESGKINARYDSRKLPVPKKDGTIPEQKPAPPPVSPTVTSYIVAALGARIEAKIEEQRVEQENAEVFDPAALKAQIETNIGVIKDQIKDIFGDQIQGLRAAFATTEIQNNRQEHQAASEDLSDANLALDGQGGEVGLRQAAIDANLALNGIDGEPGLRQAAIDANLALNGIDGEPGLRQAAIDANLALNGTDGEPGLRQEQQEADDALNGTDGEPGLYAEQSTLLSEFNDLITPHGLTIFDPEGGVSFADYFAGLDLSSLTQTEQDTILAKSSDINIKASAINTQEELRQNAIRDITANEDIITAAQEQEDIIAEAQRQEDIITAAQEQEDIIAEAQRQEDIKRTAEDAITDLNNNYSTALGTALDDVAILDVDDTTSAASGILNAIDRRLNDEDSELKSAIESFKVSVKSAITEANSRIEESFGSIDLQNPKSLEEKTLRELILLMFIFSILEANEWEEKVAEADTSRYESY